ncbi:ribonucleotide reductase subunit 2 [Macacine alphaherpesvirus 1]|uniref:ribonucleoside-diphosphate reductase n=2 Tax=Cercopithecine herpesvirus 1 TaxID=10325 RepID=Q805Y9_CHV1|nr:ribonucleotide reductase subunit 2 [Macacine alphaherpesvirus 1]AAP41458.1 small subunit of ribonucleotide reductase [Macacine alphaherpesvirus 1]ARS01902.1 ribonucleotide reductase subunit 2 [Macacine alphaherpesvirus 1]ARS02860.1 ribonucleotide reductase subunit 2 [Macacine alphaherpesvirus 1]BAC58080.1 ribonucleotide reductase small subunit [Macacine alphaherpesvirus 1]
MDPPAPTDAAVPGGSLERREPAGAAAAVTPDPERYFYTTQCPDINHLRSLSILNRWLESELVFAGDEEDVHGLTDDELNFYRFLFTFLSAADDLVTENLGGLSGLFPQKDILHYYVEQEAIEVVHSRVYSIIQLVLFHNNEQARREYVSRTIHHPAIRVKVEWLEARVQACESVPEKFILMILIEGIFFAASFAAIGFLRTNNLLRVTCQSNDLISRDEAVHTTASCYIYNNYLGGHRKPTAERVYRLFREAVDIEIGFIRSQAPANSRVLDAAALDAIENYVRFSADRLLVLIKMKPLFGAPAPAPSFPLSLMSTEKHTNFFECRSTAYAGAVVNDL